VAETSPDFIGKSRIVVAGPNLSGILKKAIETKLIEGGLIPHVHDLEVNQTGARRHLEHDKDSDNLNGNVVAGVVYVGRPEAEESDNPDQDDLSGEFKAIDVLANEMKLPTFDYGSSSAKLERSLAALGSWATDLNVTRLELVEPPRPDVEEAGPQAQSA